MFVCRLLLALIMMTNLCQALEIARPNVVVFLVDDMGWQETSVPFHTEVTELNRRYHTPNMERMANQGVKFTQAYASAVCSPTRVSLLSGMNAARHRVTSWTLRKDRSPDQASKFIEPPRWNLNGMTTDVDADRATRITLLPALLKTAGYRTIHVGKAHFGAKGTAGEDPRHFGCDVNHVLKIDLQPQESPLSGIPIPVPTARVMTFNILQGAANAGNVGFDNASFGGSRLDEIVDVIKLAQADVVGVQEDSSSDNLLKALGSPWQRVGSVYSRLPVKEISVDEYLTVVAVGLPGGKVVTLVNCHWLPPRGGYGPDLAQAELRALPDFVYSEAVAKRIIEKCSIPNGTRGYNATLQPLKAAIESGKNVILTGDFNEPSHLDWTQRYAEKGSDRWVMNPTDVPLRFAVEWPGSTQLAKAGLIDSYRMIHSDEVVKPGITWTPKYAENTPGRRPYHEQVLDRIDRVYHSGDSLRPIAAEVVGEAREVADLVFTGRWPSDHRAVVVTFECQ